MHYSKYLKAGASFLTVLICSGSIVCFQKANLKQQESAKSDLAYIREEKQLTNLAKILQQIPSFGFDNLLADWAFLQFVQYYGDTEAREVTGYSVVTDYFETVVNRDPNFIQSHLIMSPANSLFAARPQKTVELMNKASKLVTPQTPGYPFLLWTYKATDEILFMGNIEAAKNSYKMAAKWASMRNDELGEEMASRYRTSTEFLATNPDSTDAQIKAWINVLNQASDEKTQQHVMNKLEALGVDISIDEKGKIKVIRKDRA